MFSIKIQSKKLIRGKYVYYTLHTLPLFFFSILTKIVSIAPSAIYLFTAKNQITPSGVILLFFLTLLLYFPVKWCKATIGIRLLDRQEQGKTSVRRLLRRSLWVLFAEQLILGEKLLFGFLYFCPAFLCLFIRQYLLYAGKLYSLSGALLNAASLLLAIGGLIFYICTLPLWEYTRYATATSSSASFREIFHAGQNEAAKHLKILLRFKIEMLPWKLLAFLPFAAFYCIPYLTFCKKLLFDRLQQQNNSVFAIKIYEGKNLPARIIAES